MVLSCKPQSIPSDYNATIMASVASRPHRYTTRYDFQCVTERFLRAWCWIAGRNNYAHWFTRNVLSTQEYNVWVGVVNTHINMARKNTRTHVYVCVRVLVCVVGCSVKWISELCDWKTLRLKWRRRSFTLGGSGGIASCQLRGIEDLQWKFKLPKVCPGQGRVTGKFALLM